MGADKISRKEIKYFPNSLRIVFSYSALCLAEGLKDDGKLITIDRDKSLYEKVNDEESAHSSREIATKEGIFVGYTSGACLQAIRQLNKRSIFNKKSVIVTIFCDHGSRYMSKIFSDKWMKEQGFDQKSIEQESSIEYIR